MSEEFINRYYKFLMVSHSTYFTKHSLDDLESEIWKSFVWYQKKISPVI